MTLEQTAQVMDVLTTAYPRFYAGADAPDPEKALTLWASMFQDDEMKIVVAAVKALIATDTRGFPPHIGAVKARIRQITQPEGMTEVEAWGLVSKALKKSAYRSKEEFEKLPPLLQNLVGSPGQLRDWALMDSDTVQSVVSSNFQRSYKVRAEGERQMSMLPADVRTALPNLRGIPEATGWLPLGKEAMHD